MAFRRYIINGVRYTAPSANAAGVLTDNGAGVLNWLPPSAAGGSAWINEINTVAAQAAYVIPEFTAAILAGFTPHIKLLLMENDNFVTGQYTLVGDTVTFIVDNVNNIPNNFKISCSYTLT